MDFSSKRWEKNRDFQTEMLAYVKAQWYAVLGNMSQHMFLLKHGMYVDNKGSLTGKAARGKKGRIFPTRKLSLHPVGQLTNFDIF